MKLNIVFTKQFNKDIKNAQKMHKNLELVFEIVDTLSKGIELDFKYKDHNLKGKYSRYRECHVEFDFLLIYRVSIENNTLVLFRLGTHSELFK